MPYYRYSHPKTNEIKDIFQSMNDLHEYVDEKGIKWNRIFTAPELNTQDKLSAESSAKDFSRVVADQKGTMGDLWDRSAELSEKRKKLYGEDKVKKEYYENWSKKRKGKIHPKKLSE